MRIPRSAGIVFLLVLAVDAALLADPTPTAPIRWRVSDEDSPGVSVWLVETGRQTLSDGTPEITYSVHASGFPRGAIFALWMKRVEEEPVRIVGKRFVDETGEMLVSEFGEDTEVPWLPAPLNEVLPITLDHFQPAEPIFLKVEAHDRSVVGHSIEFPVPVEDRDAGRFMNLLMP